jgi:prophage maintenance system killer protein
MKLITIDEVKRIAFVLAQKQLVGDEPIPDFRHRFSGRLENCLAQSNATYAQRQLYPTLLDKASITFYLMIKNHPFLNGNKRIAVTSLMLLMYKNNFWLKIDPWQFYEFAVWVAKSPAVIQKEVVLSIRTFIKSHLVKRSG